MAIIFGIFFGLLRAFSLPRAMCGLVLIPLIWFYAALTGWPASAIRATVMLTVLIVGWVLKRPSDLINSLFAAAFIILVWQPQQLLQAGFQLSFLVVLCIILIMPSLKAVWDRFTAPDPLLPASLRPRWPAIVYLPATFILDTTLTSAAAWIGSVPLVAYYFHIVSPVSTPANVLAVPLCGLCLMSNLASLLTAAWFPAAAALFNHAGWFWMEAIRVTSIWFANWPRAYFYVGTPTLFGSALYYSLLIAAVTGWLFSAHYRRWKLSAFGAATLAWAVLTWWNSATTRLHILPISGAVTAFCSPALTRESVLIDCGTTNGVRFLTKPFLRAQGVNQLPNLVLTHGDLHHVGGAKDIVEVFAVPDVWVSPVRFRSPAYRQVVTALDQQGNHLRKISRNDSVAGWTVLHPDAGDRFPQADDNAIVLSRNFGGTRVLLVSDLGRPGQDALMDRQPDLSADILVTGLPFKPEAIADSLLQAIQPKLIVVADSEFPISERAPKALCKRLERCRVPVIYTRLSGAVTFSFRGKDWQARTMNGQQFIGRSLPRFSTSPVPEAPVPEEQD